MATEGNGGLGSSEEVREGQLMGPTLESVDASLMEGSTQNRCPCLKPKIDGLVREAFERFWKSGPESVAAFFKEGSTQNTSTTCLDSKIHTLVREAFEHFMKSGPEREQIQELYRGKLQLRFLSSLPLSFFTGKKVEGRRGALIRVNLIDTSTGHVVSSGPLSSLKLDVVVLEGDFENKDDDWTQEIFESHVAKQRTGKPPLLTGDLQVSLKEGEGSLGKLQFTDNSSWMRSGKLRLGVKVPSGFYMGIRVREAITAPFEVKHFKKTSKEKHVPRALDDDVCTLMGIGKNGAFHKNLNNAGISKVKDFLWKLGLDPKGLRTIVGKTMSEKNWKTLGDHAKESIPCGKYHVYYADDTNSSVVFENMSELCGLIEDGKYYLVETLSENKKVLADNLKKEACAKWKDIVEYDGLLPLEMNPSKRARISETDVVTFAPESCPSDFGLASSSYVGPLVNPGQDIGAPVPCQPPSVPSGEASKSSMPDSEWADLIDDILNDDRYLSSLLCDPPAQADVNSVCSIGGLDTFGREDDHSDSHLPPSSLHQPEQANGRKVVWEWGCVGVADAIKHQHQPQPERHFLKSGYVRGNVNLGIKNGNVRCAGTRASTNGISVFIGGVRAFFSGVRVWWDVTEDMTLNSFNLRR